MGNDSKEASKPDLIEISRIEIKVGKMLKKNKIKQYELIRKTGLSPQTISNISRGETKNIRLHTFILIAEFFDVPLNELIKYKVTK